MNIDYRLHYVGGFLFFSSLFLSIRSFLLKHYLLKKLPFSDKIITESDAWDISGKIVTSVFSFIGTAIGFIIIASVWHDFMHGQHWLTNVWARFGVSYYLYDTMVKIQCTFYEHGDPQKRFNIFYKVFLFLKYDSIMFFHHIILPPLLFPCILVHRRGLHDIVFAISYAFDVPVPFIQLRFLLYRLDLKNSALYVVNGILMTLTFALFRVVVFPWVLWIYANRTGLTFVEAYLHIPLKCSITLGVVWTMQVYWLALMVRGVVKFFVDKEHVQTNGGVNHQEKRK